MGKRKSCDGEEGVENGTEQCHFISSSLIKIILISVMVLLRCLEAGEKATSNCYFLEN